jgi:hypothetical protein
MLLVEWWTILLLQPKSNETILRGPRGFADAVRLHCPSHVLALRRAAIRGIAVRNRLIHG